jgi:hypothetical protein
VNPLRQRVGNVELGEQVVPQENRLGERLDAVGVLGNSRYGELTGDGPGSQQQSVPGQAGDVPGRAALTGLTSTV